MEDTKPCHLAFAFAFWFGGASVKYPVNFFLPQRTFEQHVQVAVVAQILGVNDREVERVLGAETHAPRAARVQPEHKLREAALSYDGAVYLLVHLHKGAKTQSFFTWDSTPKGCLHVPRFHPDP